jgi:hypothetical protein
VNTTEQNELPVASHPTAGRRTIVRIVVDRVRRTLAAGSEVKNGSGLPQPPEESIYAVCDQRTRLRPSAGSSSEETPVCHPAVGRQPATCETAGATGTRDSTTCTSWTRDSTMSVAPSRSSRAAHIPVLTEE